MVGRIIVDGSSMEFASVDALIRGRFFLSGTIGHMPGII
jgi:hypothetical protein